MKVSLQKVLKAFVAIREIEKDKSTPKWAYGIAKNKGLMQNDIDGIAAAEKIFQEVDQERVKYLNEHGEKDKDGKPVIENGMYKGVNEKDPELLAIMEKSKAAVENHSEVLKKETDINFHMIDFEDLPKEITPDHFEALSVMIKDPK